jgi:predicted nucleotidyltransferase
VEAPHQDLFAQLESWAPSQKGILGILLVGSQASGTARPDSDVDLVIIAENCEAYLSKLEWAAEFGDVSRTQTEDWGKLTSPRVWYQAGLEVEFGFADKSWAATALDAGTQDVLAEGYRILFERDDLLTKAITNSLE